MARNLKVSLLGEPLLARDYGTGQAAVDRMIAHWQDIIGRVLPDEPDLIVLPECCDHYLVHDEREAIPYYETRGDQMRDALCQIARDHACNIAYAGTRWSEEKMWRNSIQMIDRQGLVVDVYDKNYPVVGELELGEIVPGTASKAMACDFGRVGGAICFDLNFSDLRASYEKQDLDLIVFSSYWHGSFLQPNWAYACRCYFLSTIGGAEFKPSSILSPVGEVVATNSYYQRELTAVINLDYSVVHLDNNVHQLQAAKAKYGPKISLSTTDCIAAILLTSETEEFSSSQILDEFGMEPIDAFFERSRQAAEDKVI